MVDLRVIHLFRRRRIRRNKAAPWLWRDRPDGNLTPTISEAPAVGQAFAIDANGNLAISDDAITEDPHWEINANGNLQPKS